MSRPKLEIAVLGALGALTVLTVSWGVGDPVAYAVLGLIGATFGVGIAELWARVGRAQRRRDALRHEAVEGIQDWIGLARAGASPGAPVGVTPYLVGLLVMLGVLGTFLGLVDTLGGAGALIGQAGDLPALRADLAAPLGGLTRAFTTSLAGIGASACLGLALVRVRREERRARREFAAYAARVLSPQTPGGRQLACLEAIAAQGAALPAAAEAMAQIVTRLETLGSALERRVGEGLSEAATQVRAAQLETAATLQAAFSEHAERLRDSVASGFEAAQAQTTAAVERLAERASARAAEAASGAFGRAVEQLQGHLEAAAAARAEAERAHLAAVQGQLGEAQAALGAAVSQTAERAAEVSALMVSLQSSLAAAEVRTGERLGEVVTAVSAELSAQAEAARAAQAAHTAAAAEVLTRLDDELSRHLLALGERLAAPLTAVAQAAERAPAAAAALVERAAGELSAAQAAEAARNQALDAVVARLDAAGLGLERLSAQQRASGTAIEAEQRAHLDALLTKMDATLERQAARLAAFEGELAEGRAEAAGQLAQQLTAHAAGLGERLGATTAVVREAADLLRAGGAELSAVAEMFADAVDGYRASSDSWLQTLGELQGALGRSGEEEAGRLVGEYLDQTREVFGDAMRFQRELFTELRALRSPT